MRDYPYGWARETKRRVRASEPSPKVGAFTRGDSHVVATHRTILCAADRPHDWDSRYSYGGKRKPAVKPARKPEKPCSKRDLKALWRSMSDAERQRLLAKANARAVAEQDRLLAMQ